MCEVRSRKNGQEQKKEKRKQKYSGQQQKEIDCDDPSRAEWKNATHPVDRTANWCIGGCWFTLPRFKNEITASLMQQEIPV